jgi:hypothetical protein|tara:strand:- start:7143 stop:7412 length:270 start_codon:yes stop_codon:yes gene_type:complete
MSILEERTEDEKKGDALVMYVKSLATIESAIEPFKEQRKGLRASYIENGRLSREEINMATKCYRMLKKNEDIDDLVEVFKTISKKVKGV